MEVDGRWSLMHGEEKKERKRKEQEEENIVRRVVYNDTNLMRDKR